jgi:hypothetical protein
MPPFARSSVSLAGLLVLLGVVVATAIGGCGEHDGPSSGDGSPGGAAGSNSAGTGGTGGNGDTGGTGGVAGGSGGTANDGRGTVDAAALPPFSFFVTSLAALRRLSGSEHGFGGDLSYGESGEGAGLRGADKICAEIAESSMPGAGAKAWRAYLSAPTGGSDGGPVHAIDRIGPGPWYDRLGRLFASSRASLNGFRPVDADDAIKNDFPNEHGVPNHNPDGTGVVDNHDTLTGSAADGTLYTATANPTCSGWTSKEGAAGRPRVGHSWPRRSGGSCPNNNGCYGHWTSSLDEAGCAPGVNLIEMGGPKPNDPTVGSGGGYGGFYCFALTP